MTALIHLACIKVLELNWPITALLDLQYNCRAPSVKNTAKNILKFNFRFIECAFKEKQW